MDVLLICSLINKPINHASKHNGPVYVMWLCQAWVVKRNPGEINLIGCVQSFLCLPCQVWIPSAGPLILFLTLGFRVIIPFLCWECDWVWHLLHHTKFTSQGSPWTFTHSFKIHHWVFTWLFISWWRLFMSWNTLSFNTIDRLSLKTSPLDGMYICHIPLMYWIAIFYYVTWLFICI